MGVKEVGSMPGIFQAIAILTFITAFSFAASGTAPSSEVPGWVDYRSPHFALYFAPDSKYLKEEVARKKELDTLEAQLDLVCKELSVPKPNLIKYYYFDRWDDGKKWGVAVGTASPKIMSVYHVHACMHELVHIVEPGIKGRINPQYNGSYRMLHEGLADWIGTSDWAKIGCRQTDHFKVTRDMQALGTLPTIQQMCPQFQNRTAGDYTPAASFCGYLIRSYGMPKFLKLFSAGGRPEDYQGIYGKTTQQLDWEWTSFLASYTTPDEPRILSAVPPNGTENVRPGVTELRLVFDRDMKPEYDIIGQPTPRTIGHGSWEDKRTWVIGARLGEGTKYLFQMNRSKLNDFCSSDGIQLPPCSWVFSTSKNP